MKLRKSVSVLAIVMFGLICTVGFITNLASARPLEDVDEVTAVSALPVIDDFEAGLPADWYWDADWGNTAMTTTVVTQPHMVVPGQITNSVFSLEFVSGGWGGSTGNNFASDQDWSTYDGVSFWMYGTNSGTSLKFTLTDDGGEGFEALFTDNAAGWQWVSLPWSSFSRASWQPGGAPDDGLTLTAVGAYGFFLIPGTSGQFFIDEVKLFQTPVNLIDDYESGLPAGWYWDADWGNTAMTTTVVTQPHMVVPGQITNSIFSLEFVSGGWGGSTGNNLSVAEDWSTYDGVSFWLYGTNSGTSLKFTLTDDGGEGFEAFFTDNVAGWQLVSLPWEQFARASWQPGGAPDDGLTLTAVSAYGFFLIPGTSGQFFIDEVQVFQTPSDMIDDYESGLPAGWYWDADWGNTAMTTTVVTQPHMVVPGQITNSVFSLEFVSGGWGGSTGNNLPVAEDWSTYDGVSFWLYGTNSGTSLKFTLTDDGGEGFEAFFTDNEAGWQLVSLPWEQFARASWQPGGAPDDGLTLTAVGAYGFFLIPGTSGQFFIDEVAVFSPEGAFYIDQIANPPGVGEAKVRFSSAAYSVNEGAQALVTVELSMTATDPVTVSYATSDGTAVAGTHYTATSGALIFPAGSVTQTFTVDTIDNDDPDGDKTLNLTLSDPIDAALGIPDEVVLTIEDDEQVDICSNRATTIDDFENGLPAGEDANENPIGFFAWQDPDASTTVTFTTNLVSDSDPLALPGQSGDNHLYQVDVNIVSWGGATHAFENIPVDTWTPQDWSSYEGISFWLYGQNTGDTLLFEVQDNRPPGSTGAEAEIWNYTFTDDFSGWKQFQLRFSEFNRKEIGNGAPNDGFGLEEVHAWAFGSLETGGADVTYYMDNVIICGNADTNKPLAVEFDQSKYSADEGETAVLTVTLNKAYTETVSVDYATAESNARVERQYTPVSGTLTFAVSETVKTIEIQTMADGKHTGNRNVAVNLYENDVPLDFQRRAILTIVDSNPANPRLVDDFEGYYPYTNIDGTVDLSVLTIMDDEATAVPYQYPYEDVLSVDFDTTVNPVSFDRGFARGQDWSSYDGLSFWYYGSNSGETVALQLKDNMTATTDMVDPSEWVMVWSDEFNDPAGTPPNPNIWQYELGDGALNGIVGWGNSELQYYTNDPANAATDGNGNLVIRLQEVDTATTDLVCWYGPCEYTSARLITQDRIDFEFGRIEARVQLPAGPDGLWPAFWMLGSNIDEEPWPQSGEIDIMEYVSRRPDEVFGTLHGPGYSGGNGYGNIYTFPGPVAATTHTFAIEWSLDAIDWYVDDIHYHDAIPADVSPNEWVYNHPFFTILNMAIGGNFGGAVSDSMTMPQETLVDYVRVYQAADAAERFEATFVDDFTGWQKVHLPWAEFVRSSEQPVGAPDDGLTLTDVWGYGFVMPDGTTGSFMMDQVYLYNQTTYYFPIMFKN